MVGLEILAKIQPKKRYEFLQTFELMTQSNHKARAASDRRFLKGRMNPTLFYG